VNAAAPPTREPGFEERVFSLLGTGPGKPAWAVIDGARDPRIASWLVDGSLAECLYRGPVAPELRAAAPSLLRVIPGHELTNRFFREGWHASWGIALASPAPKPEMLIELIEGGGLDKVEVEVEGEKKVDIKHGGKVVAGASCKLKLAGAAAFSAGPGELELQKDPKVRVRVSYQPETQMKTWLRPGKWSSKLVKSATVQALAANSESFDGAAVDRAFYKSCNLMALQTLAVENLLG